MVDVEPPESATENSGNSRSATTGHREFEIPSTYRTIKTTEPYPPDAGLLSGDSSIISPITACDPPFLSTKLDPYPHPIGLCFGLGR